MTAPEAALCPRCGHAQTEASGAVSTYCRACGQHFLLAGTPRKQKVRMPRKDRIVTCFHCGEENRVTTAALSTQCLYCSCYLDLSDHRIEGANSEKLQTYGSIAFMPGCHHASLQVYAHSVVVSGLVDAKLWAESQIEFKEEGRLRGTAQSAKVIVARAAQAVANDVHAEDLDVRGLLQARYVYVTGELHVHAQGGLRAEKIFAPSVRVVPGGELRGDLETVLGPEARVLPAFFEKKASAKAASGT